MKNKLEIDTHVCTCKGRTRCAYHKDKRHTFEKIKVCPPIVPIATGKKIPPLDESLTHRAKVVAIKRLINKMKNDIENIELIRMVEMENSKSIPYEGEYSKEKLRKQARNKEIWLFLLLGSLAFLFGYIIKIII